LLVTGKGREALFLKGTEEEARAALQRVVSPQTPVRVEYLGSPDNAALLFQATPPRTQAEVQSRFAALAVEKGADLDDTITSALNLVGHLGAQQMVLGEEVRQLYGLGKGDLAVAKQIAALADGPRRRATVFVAGMIGQDVADRLRSYLGVGRVFSEDIKPASVRYMLHRYNKQQETATRLLLLLAEFLPPRENVVVHLAMGE
jgi:hypothetical protein